MSCYLKDVSRVIYKVLYMALSAGGGGSGPGTAAGRSHPATEARGSSRKEQPHVQGVVAARAQEGIEEPTHVEGQEGRREEIPLIQGQEQRPCFVGAAMKRYPTPKVRETQVRW